MKKELVFILIVLCCTIPVIAQSVPGELLIQFDNEQVEVVKVDPQLNLSTVASQLTLLPTVQIAEPNYLFTTDAHPNDPSYNAQYALDIVNARMAWDITQGNESIIIAVIDTGVDWNHPDLLPNVWNNSDEVLDANDTDANGYVDDIRGYDFLSSAGGCAAEEDCDTIDNDPTDIQGHGTHVAGIAAARGNNSLGISGLCPRCSIMPLRAGYQGTDGRGYLTASGIVDAIHYATQNGAHIISMSFSGPDLQSIHNALDAATEQGVILVAAAGNYNTATKQYPGAYDNVLAVTSTTQGNAKSSFSTYGTWTDVAAPGSSIYSTYVDDTYSTISGTSMSTPLVAGLAGLLLSRDTNLTPDVIITAIHSAVMDLSGSTYIGTGIINAFTALVPEWRTVALLDPLLDDVLFTGHVPIVGTVQGQSLLNYSIYYGMGAYPDNWSHIATKTNSVTNDVLAVWDTSLLDNGTYSIKVVAHKDEEYAYGRTAYLAIEPISTTSISNGTYQTFVATDKELYQITVHAGADNSRYHLDLHTQNGTKVSSSDSFTVFSDLQEAVFTFDRNLTTNETYRIVFVLETGGPIDVRTGSYANGSLSTDNSTDVAFSLYARANVSIPSFDMTLFSIENSLFSFDNVTIEKNSSSVTLSYNTSQDTNATIFLGSNHSHLTRIASNDVFSMNHSFTLLNLSPNTTYYAKPRGCNSQTTCNELLLNFTTLADTTVPGIFNLSANNITNHSALITWVTNEATDGLVSFWQLNSSPSYTYFADRTVIHAATIANLSDNTTYYINVTSCDFSQNCNAILLNITTLPTDAFPSIAAIAPVNGSIFNDSNISLHCNATDDHQLALMYFYFGESGSQSVITTVILNTTFAFRNTAIANLQTGTYEWSCAALDHTGQMERTANYTFIVDLPPSPPAILDIDPNNGSVLASTTTQVAVDLDTDLAAECRFHEKEKQFDSMTSFDETNDTDHDHTFGNITDSSTYAYFIQCLDHKTNLSTLTTYTFSTDAPPVPSSGTASTGGGGGTSPSTTREQPFFTSSPTTTTLREIDAPVDNTDIVKRVRIRTVDDGASVRVNRLDTLPVQKPIDNAILYLEIAADADVSGAEIDFSLEKGEYDEHSVVLHHFSHNDWVALQTTLIGADQTHVHYTASAPHFSYFAVTAQPKKQASLSPSAMATVQKHIREAPLEYVPMGGIVFLFSMLLCAAVFWAKRRT